MGNVNIKQKKAARCRFVFIKYRWKAVFFCHIWDFFFNVFNHMPTLPSFQFIVQFIAKIMSTLFARFTLKWFGLNRITNIKCFRKTTLFRWKKSDVGTRYILVEIVIDYICCTTRTHKHIERVFLRLKENILLCNNFFDFCMGVYWARYMHIMLLLGAYKYAYLRLIDYMEFLHQHT